MLERTIDKKIRVLKEILQSKNLDTHKLSITGQALLSILKEFEKKQLINIKSTINIPDFDEAGDPIIDILTDEYLIYVTIVDKKKLLKLLKEYEIQSPKREKPLIREKALELISIEIGEMDSGTELVKLLKKWGVDEELIIYPNTKWRMIKDVLVYLAYSARKEDRNIIFKIIEETVHPLMYGGDKNLAKKTADKFNGFLEYDNFVIKEGVLWEGWEDESGILMWNDKDGSRIEPDVYLIFPKTMDKLYVYWNELIKLTKFYFSNKNSQDDEINDIYFEIITNVEKLLNGDGCGGLKEIYKKPFGNMIGCEFEMQKQGLTTDGLFVNLYDFLGKITELSLPDKNNVRKIKKDNSAFLVKIKQYSEQHLARKKIIQKPPATKIEITKMPELKIKKSRKLSKNKKSTNEKIFKLSPEIYGIGMNLEALWQKIKSFWSKRRKKEKPE